MLYDGATVFATLRDVLSHVLEFERVWSPARLDEATSSPAEGPAIADGVKQVLAVCDVYHMSYMVQQFTEYLQSLNERRIAGRSVPS